jgi:hypothetical protein
VSRIVVIAGTDTSVGKTVITAARPDLADIRNLDDRPRYTSRPLLGVCQKGLTSRRPRRFLQAAQTGLHAAVEAREALFPSSIGGVACPTTSST